MKPAERFDLRRCAYLMHTTVRLNRRKIGTVAAAVGILLLLVCTAAALGRPIRSPHRWLYPFTLFAVGFFVTPRAFYELQTDATAIAWLTLPASTAEKFISRWCLTSIGVVAATLAGYTLVAAATRLIYRLTFQIDIAWFDPLDPYIWKRVAAYLVMQSVLLTASVYFRRLVMVKTALFLAMVLTALIVVIAVAFHLLFDIDVSRMMMSADGGPLWSRLSGEWLKQVANTLRLMFRIGFWLLLAPYCWLLGYVRLKEIEV